MHTITALLLAAASACLHAAPLPARSAIFNSAIYSRPAISASGRWIASTAVSDGKLRLFPMDGGAAKPIVLPPGARGNYYRWTNDSEDALIIVTGGEKGGGIYRFDAEQGTLTSVTGSDYTQAFAYGTHTNNYAFTYQRYRKGETEFDLSPAGQMVAEDKVGEHLPAYLADGQRYFHIAPAQNDWTFSAGSNAAARGSVKITSADTRRAGGLVSVSNDGRAWILSSYGQAAMGLFSLDTATGERTAVALPPADIAKVILDPLTMTPDFVDYETDRPQRLMLNPRVGPDLTLLGAIGNGVPTILDRSPNDRYWVVAYLHRDGTPRMLGYDRRTRKTMALPAEVFSYLDSANMRVRPFTIHRPDGVQISGQVTLPRAGVCERKRCPAVLLVHGGPATRDAAAFDPTRFWLASRGIAVINVNYRGSSGFGERFQNSDVRQWGDAIPKDVNAGLAHALAHFPLDRRRVAAMGSSFGGFLSLHLAATGAPLRCAVADSFSADIVKFGERMLSKYGEQSDILTRVGDTRIAADKAAMMRMSPASHVDQLKAIPVLHLQGGNDQIIHLDDNMGFADAMLAASTQYTFVTIPEAGHGLYPGRAHYLALTEAFLGKCLGVPVEPINAAEAASLARAQFKGNRAFAPQAGLTRTGGGPSSRGL